jgi:integrase
MKYGSGSIFRKPLYVNGKRDGVSKYWTIQYYRRGKRIREATGESNFEEAKKLLRQRLHEIDKNEYIERRGRAAKVEDLYTALKEHNQNNRKSSIGELDRRWKHLNPTFGSAKAAEVTTDDIRHYIRGRQEQKAADATINRELATLRRMFRLAMQSTPPKVSRVPHMPMLKENNVRRGFVEDADFAKLAANANELWLRLFLELAFTYGWRKGELLGLRVRQVNLKNLTIRLDPGTTKNYEGREVAMTTKVAELLRLAVARKKPDDYLLTHEARRGQPFTRVRDFRKAWWNLCVRAGLGEFVCRACGGERDGKKCGSCGSRAKKYSGLIPHDLRRSAAKALRSAGVSESVIMAAGGWKTAAMFRRYAIVSSADQRAAVEMLERARAKQIAPATAPFEENSPLSGQELGSKLQ